MIYNIDKLTKQYGDLTKQEIKYLRTCNSLERWEKKTYNLIQQTKKTKISKEKV